MTELLLFGASFAATFLGAYQVRNIAGGHVAGAALVSVVYSSVFAVMFKVMPSAGWSDIAAYAAGNCGGVVLSMKLHMYMHDKGGR